MNFTSCTVRRDDDDGAYIRWNGVHGVLAVAGGEFDSTTINVGQQCGC